MVIKYLQNPAARDAPKDITQGIRLCGVLVLDIDGTLTYRVTTGRPGEFKDEIHPAIPPLLGDFASRGGSMIISSNQPLNRTEKELMIKIAPHLRLQPGITPGKIVVCSEQGTYINLMENAEAGGNLIWKPLRTPIYVPGKDTIEALLQKEGGVFKTAFPDSELREGGVTTVIWRKLSRKRGGSDEAERIVRRIMPEHGVPLGGIDLEKGSGYLIFLPKGIDKAESAQFTLEALAKMGVSGPAIGFGDKSDKFAAVVQTINVNTANPNVFRTDELTVMGAERKGLPAMELVDWVPLEKGEYTIDGNTPDGVVKDKSGNPITVVRHGDGTVATAPGGTPLQAKPFNIDGRPTAGGGEATAWMVKKLIDDGFFSPQADEFKTQVALTRTLFPDEELKKVGLMPKKG